MSRNAKSHMQADSVITFADTDSGRNLFTLMMRAGLLAEIPPSEFCGWVTYALELDDGTLTATISGAAKLDSLITQEGVK
jgi:hypothetical protein